MPSLWFLSLRSFVLLLAWFRIGRLLRRRSATEATAGRWCAGLGGWFLGRLRFLALVRHLYAPYFIDAVYVGRIYRPIGLGPLT